MKTYVETVGRTNDMEISMESRLVSMPHCSCEGFGTQDVLCPAFTTASIYDAHLAAMKGSEEKGIAAARPFCSK